MALVEGTYLFCFNLSSKSCFYNMNSSVSFQGYVILISKLAYDMRQWLLSGI